MMNSDIIQMKKNEGIRVHTDVASALSGVILKAECSDVFKNLLPEDSVLNCTKPVFFSENGMMLETESVPGIFTCDGLADRIKPAAAELINFWLRTYRGAVISGETGHDNAVAENVSDCRRVFIRADVADISEEEASFDFYCHDEHGFFLGYIEGMTYRIKSERTFSVSGDSHRFPCLAEHSDAFSVIELDALTPFAHKTLSEKEMGKYKRLGNIRKTSFLAARIAGKLTCRKLSSDYAEIPSQMIDTVKNDLVRPYCPVMKGGDNFCCSVSHDSRFALSAVSGGRLGVDVETLSERVIRGQRIYMHGEEMKLVKKSDTDEIGASLRVWSIKESVSKAIDLYLAKVWKRVEIREVGERISIFTLDNRDYKAYHDTIDRHVFTILKI